MTHNAANGFAYCEKYKFNTKKIEGMVLTIPCFNKRILKLQVFSGLFHNSANDSHIVLLALDTAVPCEFGNSLGKGLGTAPLPCL